QILKVQDTRADMADYGTATGFYKTQYEILKSPALAERVIRSEALASDPGLRGTDDQAAQPGPVSKLWDVHTYLSMLQVRPVSGTSLVEIRFASPDPALSARLANAHGSGYVRYGIDLRSQTNEEASAFLQQKLAELKQRIQQSEAALNRYRRDQGIVSVDDKQNIVVQRLLDLNKS